MQLEEREAQRVLDLGVAVELDVGARPDRVKSGTLAGGERLEAERARPVEAAPRVGGERLRVGLGVGGPVVGQQLDQPQRPTRLGGGAERPACQRPVDGLDRLVAGRDLNEMLHAGRHDVSADARLVHEHRAAPVVGAQAGDQGVGRQRGTNDLVDGALTHAPPLGAVDRPGVRLSRVRIELLVAHLSGAFCELQDTLLHPFLITASSVTSFTSSCRSRPRWASASPSMGSRRPVWEQAPADAWGD